jgi:hypothetical protein
MSEKVVPITIGNLEFTCVRLSEADFKEVAAIYVIICVDSNGKWKVLDVGQTGSLGERIDGHDRKDCWIKNCPDQNIWVCVYPLPTARYSQKERVDMEKRLRDQYNPPCGKR